MAEQSPIPSASPAEASIPEGVRLFSEVADAAIGEFNAQNEWTGGARTRDGLVTTDSLATARAALVEQAAEDPASAQRLEAVAAPQVDDESDQDRRGRVIEFLKGNGGTVPIARRTETSVADVQVASQSKNPRTARRMGHQLLVDGHVVLGERVLGRDAVQTSEGILHTRGTPRTGLN